MRRGAYSLSGLVRNELNRDPLSAKYLYFSTVVAPALNCSAGNPADLYCIANI